MSDLYNLCSLSELVWGRQGILHYLEEDRAPNNAPQCNAGHRKTLLVCTGYFLATWLAELDVLLLANYILL